MMIEVPAYINSFANNVRIEKNFIRFSLRCNCGCELFWLIKNNYTDEESRQIEESERINDKKVGWHTIYGGIDNAGKPYQYYKILGIFKKYFEWEPEPLCAGIKVIKAICVSCKNEFVVFDNRFNGYDSMFTESEALDYIPHFDNVLKEKECNVTIEIELDEESNDVNLFSSINIYAESNGKRKVFFQMETA